MIELITGLPGNAKTLYTIGEVKRRATAENRQVYYAGIKELNLDWIEIDPLKWMDVPSGGIIVIDECQKIFRNRSLSSAPPVYVTELEEHRHKGLDFYLITQHPSLIDPAIRRLTQVHKHLIRIFGMEASTVHKWNGCKDNPDKDNMRKDSEKVRWAFDKSLYGVYKSADQHTMRRSIPMRLKLLLLVPVLLALAVYGVYKVTIGKVQPQAGAATAVNDSGTATRARSERVSRLPGPRGDSIGPDIDVPSPKPFDALADARRFIEQSTPRVEGLAYTAPKYDHLTAPTRVPVPSACVQTAKVCRCYSQQGTPLDVKYNMCIDFVMNGAFQEFDPNGPDRKENDHNRGQQSAQLLRESGPARENGFAPVAVFGNPAPEAPYRPTVGKGG